MKFTSSVLIVDDDPIGRENIGALLENLGVNLYYAANGPEALEHVTQLFPDLILLDVMMPGMDGFEVCRRLRAIPQTADIPIIILTALEDRDSRLRGIDAGADDFITKPFDGIELRARVRTIIRLNRYRRLLAERAKFEYVVEQANVGYILLSSKDEITFANQQARYYLNLPDNLESLTVLNFREIVQTNYNCEPSEAWQDWPNPLPDGVRYLVRPETETENAFWLKVIVTDHPWLNAEAESLISLVDVTEQMQTQRDMWSFHSAVDHKLRTPTTFITGAIEMLENESVSEEEQRNLLRFFSGGVQRLQQALKDVLQYIDMTTWAEAGSEFNLLSLPALVTKISADLDIAGVEVTISDDLQKDCLPLTVMAMERIVWELMENAKKFHPRQAPTVDWLVTAVDDNHVLIQITDDGRTLPPDQLANIWTPYYQGEKYFTGQQTGMGLGLSLVANLVWSVGGHCSASNRDDRPGLVVKLHLPLNKNDPSGFSGVKEKSDTDFTNDFTLNIQDAKDTKN